MDRRQFIRIMGGAAGTVLISPVLPESIQRALSILAKNRTGTINDVEHVVILMQENRSFDHYFGTLRGVRGFNDRFPIPLASGKPVWNQSNGIREVLPFRFDINAMNAALIPDTPHNFPDTQVAWNQGSYGYWPKYKTDTSMGYYTREDAPFQYALADAFTICDAYHCSLLAATDPNRIVLFSGSNCDPHLRDNGTNCDDSMSEPVNVRCAVSGRMPAPGYTYSGNAFNWDTIPDVLEAAGVSWRIYQDPNNNWSGLMNGCLAFSSFRDALPDSSNYINGKSLHTIEDLRRNVIDDKLPSVSWILPTPVQSEHPGAPSSAAQGGYFTEQVLNALTSNPEVWSKTVLFLTFDENDGLFDHIPPPAVPSFYPDGSVAGKATMDVRGSYFAVNRTEYLHPDDKASGRLRPWGMGPRVPMYVISPWSRGGWVNSQVFDHTSIGMFLEQRFGVSIKAISKWHRAVSGDLTSTLDFKTPNMQVFPALPDMSRYDLIEARSKSMPMAAAPSIAQALHQEPGIRHSRALPYVLHVTAMTQPNGRIALEFRNSGTKGAVMHVYDKQRLEQIPRRYTVEAGHCLDDDYWLAFGDNNTYDLEVHGPNGFMRHFKGRLISGGGANVDISLSYDTDKGSVAVTARNQSSQPVTLFIRWNAYITENSRQIHVHTKAVIEKRWTVSNHGNWYDISIGSSDFEYRFAGRMETGRPSISDPASTS